MLDITQGTFSGNEIKATVNVFLIWIFKDPSCRSRLWGGPDEDGWLPVATCDPDSSEGPRDGPVPLLASWDGIF